MQSINHVIRNNVEGSFVECGIFRGGNIILMSKLLEEHKVEKKIFAFDTFQGMPLPEKIDFDLRGNSSIDKFTKLQNFESGIEIKGNARQPMAIKYFLVAILFVLFDVEVIFFYPYAVNFRELGWHGFVAVLMFVGLFIAGFIYIIKKGALNWED